MRSIESHSTLLRCTAVFVLSTVACARAATGLAAGLGVSRSQPGEGVQVQARAPGSYYANIDTSLNGAAFQQELTALISKSTSITYAELWTAFKTSDEGMPNTGCGAGTIDDLYSAKCWTLATEQCGNYKTEGDCYNREHTWPKSLWGGSTTVASYTDLFHLYPADGYDNNARGNYWLGNADKSTAKWVTSNGSFLGKCLNATAGAAGRAQARAVTRDFGGAVAEDELSATTDRARGSADAAENGEYEGARQGSLRGASSSSSINAVGGDTDLPALCWEPADAVKGLLARVYFFMSTRYADTWTCCDTDGANGAAMKPWLLATLLEWHTTFPLSQRELDRNEVVYGIQGNRNPFVDHPDWVAKTFVV